MKPALSFLQYAISRGFIRPRDRRSSFIRTAQRLYETYETPEKLARLYQDIYLNATSTDVAFENLDQTNPTIGAACLIALSYARYIQHRCCPKKACVTGIWLFFNELSVRFRLRWRWLNKE